MEPYNKTRVDGTIASVLVTSEQKVSGSTTRTSNVYTFRQTLFKTLSGYKNPNWKAQIARQESATTPCSGINYYRRFAPYSAGFLASRFAAPVQSYQEDYDGIFAISLPTGPVTPPSDVVTRVRNRCIRKFVKKAQEAQRRVSLGETLGELRQTIRAVTSPLSSMRDLIRGHYRKLSKAKRRYAGDPISLRKAATDTYLEFKFGWLPFASDVRGAYAALQRLRNVGESHPIFVAARASELYSGDYSEQSANTFTPRNVTFVSNSHSIYTERIMGMVGGQAAAATIPELRVFSLTTIEDFSVTAWNLLPYSFLIDYFVNVGEIIQGLTYNFAEIKWAQKTTVNKRRFHIVPKLNGTLPVSFPTSQWKCTEYLSGGRSTAFISSFTRANLIPEDLIPGVEFRLPDTLTPWANISALILGGNIGLVPFFKPR